MRIKLSLAVCEGEVDSDPEPLLTLELDSRPVRGVLAAFGQHDSSMEVFTDANGQPAQNC